jgi:hypothetical protein
MQPKPVPPPPKQLILPLEIPRQADLPQGREEAVVGRCAPQETWQTLGPPVQDQLRGTWIRVLKEVVDDAKNR